MSHEECTRKYLEGILIQFADRHTEIKGISKGNCPETGSNVYYFLIPNGKAINTEFEDSVTELDITLDGQGFVCDLLEWSVSPDEIDQRGFLGSVFWRR